MKKTRVNLFQGGLTAVLLSMAAGVGLLPLAAQPVASTPKPDVSQSVFIFPENAKQGRDPFFPNSLRPYQDFNSQPGHAGAQLTSLRFVGVSGPPNHRLVIINNHTFAEGDEEEVTTPQGKILVLCVEIGDHSVVVEANGQRIELTLSDNK
jgi:hypothetical protein